MMGNGSLSGAQRGCLWMFGSLSWWISEMTSHMAQVFRSDILWKDPAGQQEAPGWRICQIRLEALQVNLKHHFRRICHVCNFILKKAGNFFFFFQNHLGSMSNWYIWIQYYDTKNKNKTKQKTLPSKLAWTITKLRDKAEFLETAPQRNNKQEPCL